MSLKPPKAVLFDWDNTLVDTWPVIYAALHECFTEMGREPWTLDEVKQRVKHSARDAFPALFGDDWQRAADLYRDAYRARNLSALTPLPLAEEVLKTLHTEGIYLAVVSNKIGDTLRRECTHLGWDGYFSALVGSTDTAHDKPHPLPAQKALGALPPGEDVWFMGDSVVDIDIANRLNLTPILYGPAQPDTAAEKAFGGHPFSWHYADHAATLEDLRRLLST